MKVIAETNTKSRRKVKQSQQAKANKPTKPTSQQAKANNSKHKMSSNTALTMAVLMKEAIANMPDTLDTKKEVEEYFKAAMKVVNEKKKEEEKVKKAAAKAIEKAAKPATKKRGEKKEKEKEVDEDGNEVVKAKKPLSNYMKFMEEHRPKVAAIVSGLTPQELFTEVAKLWKTYKEFLTIHNGDDEERLTELWETKLEELLVKRNEERNADKEEVKDDAEEKEEVEAVEAVVVEKKGEEVKEKKPKTAKTAKTAKPVEFAKRPKMNKEEKDKKGGKKKTEESEVEKKESEDEENSS